MKTVIDDDATRLADDVLSMIRSGQLSMDHLERFLNLTPHARQEQFGDGKKRKPIHTRSLSDAHTLTLPANDGTQTIAQASDVFSSIDPDFKNWGLDVPSAPSAQMLVSVHEMVKDGNFKTIFDELGDTARLCLTQEQIIEFVRLHKEWLRTEGYGAFFLFQKGDMVPVSLDDFFVAGVHPYLGGIIRVLVSQFLHVCVWRAELRRRLIIPQLTL